VKSQYPLSEIVKHVSQSFFSGIPFDYGKKTLFLQFFLDLVLKMAENVLPFFFWGTRPTHVEPPTFGTPKLTSFRKRYAAPLMGRSEKRSLRFLHSTQMCSN
jgi:hypothetical protein